ncbi:MAG: hypothetical protein V3T16_08880 [Gemmatimonadales bacterium]
MKTIVKRSERRFLVSALALAGGLSTGLHAQDAFQGELVGEGTVSSDRGDTFPALSPDGTVLYFSRVKEGSGWSDQELLRSAWEDGAWSDPEVLPFSGGSASDRAPRPAPEGRWIIFTSNRPLPDGSLAGFNLWVARTDRTGNWYGPVPLEGEVNGPEADSHSSLTTDGTLYFSSRREGSLGRSDIWRATQDASTGEFGGVENLGSPINSELSQSDVWVKPDGSMMIFVVTDHPDGFGGDDLWVSYQSDGGWTTPRNLGPAVNTPEYEYGPFVSPDGGWLYFTSHRSGDGDIYRVRIEGLLAGGD